MRIACGLKDRSCTGAVTFALYDTLSPTFEYAPALLLSGLKLAKSHLVWDLFSVVPFATVAFNDFKWFATVFATVVLFLFESLFIFPSYLPAYSYYFSYTLHLFL